MGNQDRQSASEIVDEAALSVGKGRPEPAKEVAAPPVDPPAEHDDDKENTSKGKPVEPPQAEIIELPETKLQGEHQHQNRRPSIQRKATGFVKADKPKGKC